MSAKDFALEYEQRARDAGVPDDVAKTSLVAALNEETIQRVGQFHCSASGGKGFSGRNLHTKIGVDLVPVDSGASQARQSAGIVPLGSWSHCFGG